MKHRHKRIKVERKFFMRLENEELILLPETLLTVRTEVVVSKPLEERIKEHEINGFVLPYISTTILHLDFLGNVDGKLCSRFPGAKLLSSNDGLELSIYSYFGIAERILHRPDELGGETASFIVEEEITDSLAGP